MLWAAASQPLHNPIMLLSWSWPPAKLQQQAHDSNFTLVLTKNWQPKEPHVHLFSSATWPWSPCAQHGLQTLGNDDHSLVTVLISAYSRHMLCYLLQKYFTLWPPTSSERGSSDLKIHLLPFSWLCRVGPWWHYVLYHFTPCKNRYLGLVNGRSH